MPKCNECNKELKETFLGKLDGTIIRKKVGEKVEFEYLCSGCQKEKAALDKIGVKKK